MKHLKKRSQIVRLGWLALPVTAGLFALVGACSEEDPVTPGRDGGPDTRQPPSELPPPSIDTTPSNDAGVDARSLFPRAWNRDDNPRDASLDAQPRYCNSGDLSPGQQFCWDFGFDDGITGWQEVVADGGRHELTQSGGPPERRQALRSTVVATGDAGGRRVALRFLVPIDDIADQAAGFTLSFSFRATQVETYAKIAAIGMGASEYGLAVYPKACGGFPCVGESTSGPPPTPDFANRRPFDVTQWYRASIKLTPKPVGAQQGWGATITVGGVVVGTRELDAFPPVATFPSAVNVLVGVFDTDKGGNTQVEIDDVLLE